MLPEKRVNISQVAALAGVSKQTVSRVVNASPSVAKETRERVMEAIARLGFRPSATARNLSQGRSYTLAVVGSNLGFLATDLYQGAAAQAEGMGYGLLLRTLADSSLEQVEALLLSLLDLQVDGVLWAIPDVGGNRAWLDSGLLSRVPLPLVFMSSEPREGIVTVSFDNQAGARLATQHLIDSGHTRIAHLSGPLDWWVARERVRGWRAALAGAGLPADDGLIVEGDWSPAAGEQAMGRLLDARRDIDAVFVANDRMALGALLAAHRRGIRVPQQLALIGFDNIIESACFHPPLTTVLQDKRHHGEIAIATLAREVEARLSGKPPAQRTAEELGHTLIVRESSAT
ncbi:LacI family DNA-binding transcriptional regulator [Uliginosibacterium sp. H1]|uniref:LacI family DNA-binding transcriptional regulator n=1 Tax=Uliginosibacterium sp. H1 TaxID=3114757 RepID=UPI002E19B948|nr:LacI family DNA-binding transcriptional regulator [Uliginosibacterium sp. H1]